MKRTKIFDLARDDRPGIQTDDLQRSFTHHLEYSLSKHRYSATERDIYQAIALMTRDHLVERWIRTQQLYYDQDVKRVHYLSAEFLMGRALVNNLVNLGMYEAAREAMGALGLELEEYAEMENDAGLGSGGLGRLAACFLDSLATLEIPALGYGIRYEFGIFHQLIHDMHQVEKPDHWLEHGNPWEFARPEYAYPVKLYGRVHQVVTREGHLKTEWVDTQDVIGVAYDTPIAGYGNHTVNTLRLWSAKASKEFDLEYFRDGDYERAVEQKNWSETISKVLYPADTSLAGRELRLKQQYFFVSCSIQDIVRRYRFLHDDFEAFPDRVAIQMNDTHPALTVAELMRVLLDEVGLAWDQAWSITTRTCAYTNHTLLSEALETWPVALFERLLPRPLQIIFEINRRFLRDVSVHFLGDTERLRRVSLVQEEPVKAIRMANLAIVGSHSVNGVSALHTELLQRTLFKDLVELFPARFNNKTNGVTPRRWLLAANPDLARLVTARVGEGWITRLDQLRGLEAYLDDEGFCAQFRDVKQLNKEVLADVIHDRTGVAVDPTSLFDVQVKRIHEYKRQLLNVLHVVTHWLRLRTGAAPDAHPRTFIFAGKAAPAYFMAKRIIRLICHVAEMVNKDPQTRDRMRVVFLPNYGVSLAERIFPATDLSEQISTAGFEASGTGNMKFALNGALTIGTLDGANIEIRDAVGPQNFFLFGLTADEVATRQRDYDPRSIYLGNEELRRVLDLIGEGFFSPEDPTLFEPIVSDLLGRDRFLVLADYADFIRAQSEVDAAYRDPRAWTRRAILNVARMGGFSSDRTILEYNRDIWHAKSLSVDGVEGTAWANGGSHSRPLWRRRDIAET